MNLNKAFVLGRLTRDPETRALPSGQNVTNIGLATNRVWTDKEGARKDATEFHNVVLFGRLADIASQYLTKGALCLIVGRLQTRTWDAPDGTKRSRTEIVADELQLGPRPQTSIMAEREPAVPVIQTAPEPPAAPATGAEPTAVLPKKAVKKTKKAPENPGPPAEGGINVEDIPF